MTLALSHRAQTAKQAKAAFKTRGSSFISEAERKRLARGAELLQRAERLKAQTAKRKEWSKQKEQGQPQDDRDDQCMGSQRRLDKFGYASSQFHLGKFFGAGAAPLQARTENARPQGSADVSNDGVSETDEPARLFSESAPRLNSEAEAIFDENDDFAASSLCPGSPVFDNPTTRAGRNTPTLPSAKRHMTSFPSLTSEDGIFEFDDEVIEQCDRTVKEFELRKSLGQGPSSTVMISSPDTVAATGLMLPPPIPSKHIANPPHASPTKPCDLQSSTSAQPERQVGRRGQARRATQHAFYGITAADLDELASTEVILSQMPSHEYNDQHDR